MYMAQVGRLERKLAQKSLSNKVEKLANLLAIVLSYFLRVIVLNKRAFCFGLPARVGHATSALPWYTE